MTSTTKRAKCLSGSHSSTDGGRRYPVARSIMRKLLKAYHPAMHRGRINASILLKIAQCAKSDRLLVYRFRGSNHIDIINRPEERALARVSKDGHRQGRAGVHPSRRRASHGSSG